MANRGPVLVVDDDESILGFLQMALEEEGYEVMTAQNGMVALDIVGREPPRLILLDLRMPVMDGWQFARAYHAMAGEHAPIIVVSAGRDGHQSREEIGAEAYLDKPLDLLQLLAIVAKHMD